MYIKFIFGLKGYIKLLLYKVMQETFPADLLLRTNRALDKKQKFSVDLSYKPRSRSQRLKERSVESRQQP